MEFANFVRSSSNSDIKVYHRTPISDRDMLSGGLKPSRGIIGTGIYFTYNLQDQMQPRMIQTYGEYLVTANCDASRVLCLDQSMAARIHGRENVPLVNQLVKFGIKDFDPASKVSLMNRQLSFADIDKEAGGTTGFWHKWKHGQLDHGQKQKWWEKLFYGQAIPDMSIPGIRTFLKKYDGIIKGYLYKEASRGSVYVIDPSIITFEKLEHAPMKGVVGASRRAKLF